MACSAAAADQDANSLQIVNVQFLDTRDGYPLPEGFVFYAGEQVHLVFNVAGYEYDEDYIMRLLYRIEFLGPNGDPFAEPQTGEIREEIYPQDEDWMPIVRASPRAPFHAESGVYKIRMSVEDTVARASAGEEVSFRLEGKDLDPGAGLTISGFVLRRHEEGEPLSEPVFYRGQTLWGSFDIAGFELAEDNSFQVEARLDVISEKGKVLFSFSPRTERGSTYYPRKWLPVAFRLDLEKDMPPGPYTIHLTVRDRIAGAVEEASREFEVE